MRSVCVCMCLSLSLSLSLVWCAAKTADWQCSCFALLIIFDVYFAWSYLLHVTWRPDFFCLQFWRPLFWCAPAFSAFLICIVLRCVSALVFFALFMCFFCAVFLPFHFLHFSVVCVCFFLRRVFALALFSFFMCFFLHCAFALAFVFAFFICFLHYMSHF